MDTLTISAAVALVFLVLLSAIFSATETAYTSANRIRLKKLEEDGNRKAARSLKLMDNFEKLLTTILVGNNLVNILSSSLCTFVFTETFGSVGVVYATVFMLVVILCVGEITPKCIAKANAEKFSMMIGPFIGLLVKILTPFTWIFERISSFVTRMVSSDSAESGAFTEEELRIMVDEIEEDGIIEEAESELIKSAMEFDDKTVSEILTPRVDITAVSKNATMEDVRAVFIHSGYSRIPVYNETIDKIIGVIYSKDFYSRYFLAGRDEKITSIIRRVRFIPESTTVAKAFNEIQRSSVQMLVVIDDYGGTVGIVSLEDVLEELVGEIWDESDEVEYDIVKDSDGSYTALGDANITDLMEELEIRFDLDGYDGPTVGGFIQYKLEKVPIIGDRLCIDNVTMTVTSVRNRRIKIVRVTVEDSEESDEDIQ